MPKKTLHDTGIKERFGPSNDQEHRFWLIDPILRSKGHTDCKRFDVKYASAGNGHLSGEHDFVSSLQGGPIALNFFLTQAQLTARYAKDTGVDLSRPEAAIRTKELDARDLEARASAMDAAVFDLKAVNLNTSVKVDDRSPAKIIEDIEHQGRIVSTSLKALSQLLGRA